MELRVLGPVELVGAGGSVAVSGLRRRLLVDLVVHVGEARSTDQLVEALWGVAAPASASKLIQVYVSQLRKMLPPPARILTHGSGYSLAMEGGTLDAAVFERLLREGREVLTGGNPRLALSLLRKALDLWRGQAYGDLAYEPVAQGEAARLEELRMVAAECRYEAELALGQHAEALADLRRLADEHPLRERLQGHLMVALYRCGRQAEALDVYSATRSRLRDELGLDPGVELRRLERQVLRHDPELASAAATSVPDASTPLPSPPNRLVGREREVAELHNLLVRDDVRLLVLTGAGGSGKTRLAIEAAGKAAPSFANGTAFVALASIRDPGLMLTAIARSLRVVDRTGRVEQPLDALAAVLADREMLLVIDNAEHLLVAAPALVDLLRRAPRLTVLVTSRVVLHLSGEQVYPVEPLSPVAAASLFCERAAQADPAFVASTRDREIIDRICHRLDCLPLAVELAAGRARSLTPAELLARLEPSLRLLIGGPPDLPSRQQTLRATLEWSFALLGGETRRDLRRMAMFPAGCSLDAAQAVCGTTVDRLGILVDHHLLHRTVGTHGSRYSMLETVRDYVLDQPMESDEAIRLVRSWAGYLQRLTEPANLFAEAEGPQQFDVVLEEQDNIRAAIDRAIDHGDTDLAAGLAVTVENFWVTHNPFEGVRLFVRLLEASDTENLLRARTLRTAGGCAYQTGDHRRADQFYEQSLAIYRDLRDKHGTAIVTFRLGTNAIEIGDAERARDLLQRSLDLFDEIGSRRGEAQAMGALGSLAWMEGDHAAAASLFTGSASICADIGRKWWEARMRANLAQMALEEGNADGAEPQAERVLELATEIGDRLLTVSALTALAWVAASRSDHRTADRLRSQLEAEKLKAPMRD